MMASQSSAPHQSPQLERHHHQSQRMGWSDLPDLLLLSIVLCLTNLSDLICFAAVCRSWRRFFFSSSFFSSSDPALRRHLIFFSHPQNQPPLLLLPEPHYRFQSLDRGPGTEYSLGVNPLLDKQQPKQQHYIISLGYSHGYLILQILPPAPPPDEFPLLYSHATLSAPPDDSNSFLILLTLESVVYRRFGSDSQGDYTVHPLNKRFHLSSLLPFNNNNDRGHNVVYAINRTSNNLMEISSNQGPGQESMSIKIHDVGYATTGRYGDFEEYYLGPQLAELDGELLLVLLARNHPRAAVMYQFRYLRVCRMDFTVMRWAKADDVLESHAVFLDSCRKCAVFVSEPERWGGRRNRLYLAEQGASSWREFALDKNGLMVSEYPLPPLTVPDVTLSRWLAPMWVHLPRPS